ncbi:hypothetical protein [Massilia sp. TS11]|uniref:hypothetical protein n=1 Tax=Massilia sp. TS11 TaxID=2908003 RepID=UPI001EDA71F0|nr:hypothetical protein [Massilia sp. TS11]MCG2586134.1 hypothetical protein [Massilia sp. TS11]
MSALRLLVLLLPVLASAAPLPLRVCADRNDWVPYTYGERDGLLQQRLRQLAPRLDFALELVALPWPRCKAEVARGTMDALLGSSANPEALAEFAFPLREGAPDAARALVQTELVLLRAAGSRVSWDGQQLRGLSGQVMYIQNYREVGAALRAHGIPGDGGGLANEQNAQKVLAGRSNVMATYAGDARALLERPEFRGRLELLTPALSSGTYYLAFNRNYYKAHTAQVEALWKASARPAGIMRP